MDCYSNEYRNTWNTCIPVKLTSRIFPPFLGKQKEKSSNLYLSAWRFQEYVLRNSFIHSFILITQETPKTNVFVIRPRAEAAKWVFSYRGMSCRMAFESKLKDECELLQIYSDFVSRSCGSSYWIPQSQSKLLGTWSEGVFLKRQTQRTFFGAGWCSLCPSNKSNKLCHGIIWKHRRKSFN